MRTGMRVCACARGYVSVRTCHFFVCFLVRHACVCVCEGGVCVCMCRVLFVLCFALMCVSVCLCVDVTVCVLVCVYAHRVCVCVCVDRQSERGACHGNVFITSSHII